MSPSKKWLRMSNMVCSLILYLNFIHSLLICNMKSQLGRHKTGICMVLDIPEYLAHVFCLMGSKCKVINGDINFSHYTIAG